MARYSFHEGVLFNGLAAVLAGAGGVRAVTAADATGLAIGWSGVVLGVGLIIWGFKIDGEHWWRRVFHGSNRNTLSRFRTEFGWTFNQLVRHVAYTSEWAGEFNPTSGEDRWQRTFWWKPLKKEIFRPLVSGELHARGVLHKRNEEPDNGPTPIPAEFWRKADFFPQYILSHPTISSATNGSRGEIYDEIEVVGAEASAIWPRRTDEQLRAAPSPFVAWHQEWSEEEEDKRIEVRAQLDEQVMRQRRHLIEQGRQMVADFRKQGILGGELGFLESYAAFSSLKKHLSPQFRERLDSDVMHLKVHGKRVSSALIGQFERELDRLEDDWGISVG